MFITFEGPEGAGKSTQAKLLFERLKAKGKNVLLTREPGGTALGNKIREILLDPQIEIEIISEFLLFASSRAQIVKEVIKPALQNGKIVICDRFTDSSLAYQGYGRGLDLDFIEQINQKVTAGLIPNLTFLLDLAPEIGFKRVADRKNLDRIEQTNLAFHQRMRDGFLELAKNDQKRFIIIDASQSEEKLADIIWNKIVENLK